MRIDQLQREFELDCQYHPFPLHPDTPQGGMSLDELFGGRLDIPAAMTQLLQVAGSLELPFGERSHTYNSRNAQELGLWVAERGQFKNYEDAVYRAYFVDGVNISQSYELLKIIGSIGLDTAEASQALAEQSYAAAVDGEWDRAVSSGIRAVPSLRCEGRELVGFQSIEACRELIRGENS